jgi:hypothetical protein
MRNTHRSIYTAGGSGRQGVLQHNRDAVYSGSSSRADLREEAFRPKFRAASAWAGATGATGER